MVELCFVPDGLPYYPSNLETGFSPFPTYLADGVKLEEDTLDRLLSFEAIDFQECGGFLEPLREVTSHPPVTPLGLLTPELTPPPSMDAPPPLMDDVFHCCQSPQSSSSFAMATDRLSPVMSRSIEEPFLHQPLFSPQLSVMSPPPVIHPVPDSTPPPQGDQSPAPNSPSETVSGVIVKGEVSKQPPSLIPLEAKRKKMSEPRKLRKREQNKMAALKYRNRKKQEKSTLDDQLSQLEEENEQLHKKVLAAEQELACLKSMLDQSTTSPIGYN